PALHGRAWLQRLRGEGRQGEGGEDGSEEQLAHGSPCLLRAAHRAPGGAEGPRGPLAWAARAGAVEAAGYSAAGFTRRRVMRSLSPMARYFSASAGSWRPTGGRVHTPLGWSLVSAGLALISLLASRRKPAACAIAITWSWPT